VDFGASDKPLKPEELAKEKLLQFPAVVGGVVFVVNVPGIKAGELKLDGDAACKIFLGDIKKWNDRKIAALNAGVKLPDADITVVHRSDGSGTTAIFTDYLNGACTAWKDKVGSGTSVSWPVGIGGKGNEGVAGVVKQTPGAVGYVELAYAKQNKMTVASLRNREGQFVVPTIEGTSAAAAGAAKTMPADFRVSIVDAPGKESYPIAGLTWLLVYKDQKDEAKGKAIVQFLKWAIRDGQKMEAALDYAALPKAVAEKVDKTLRRISFKGKSLY